MSAEKTLKSRVLDDKDRKILMILQDNGREQLKHIAEKVDLSIDSVHKRIKEMQSKGVFFVTIGIDPRVIGFPLIADNKIRLKNAGQKEREDFIKYLQKHPRCTDLLGIMGEYDFTCVLVATDSEDLDKLSTEIRYKFRDIIDEWKSILVLKTYKFDTHTL